MPINESSQQFIESLTTNFFSDVIKQVHDDALAAIQSQINNADIGTILKEQIYQTVVDHFDQSLKDSISSEIEKKLVDTDFSDIVSKEIAQKLIPALEKQNWVASEISNSLAQINYNDIIKEQTAGQVQSIVPQITQTIKERVDQELGTRLVEMDVVGLITQQVTEKLIPELERQNKDRVAAEISNGLATINLNNIVRQQAEVVINKIIKTFEFPTGSIPSHAVDQRNIILSAENIVGGIFKSFESVGIQDRASQCQVTILDSATVFENKLVAAGLEVAGDMVIHKDAVFKGNVIIQGTVKEDALTSIQNRIHDTDVTEIIKDQVSQAVAGDLSDAIKNSIDKEIELKVKGLDVVALVGEKVSKDLIPVFEKENSNRVAAEITAKLAQLDVSDIVRQQSDAAVQKLVTSFNFPDWSISGRAVNPKDLVLTADNIDGGIFKSFESIGIQDRATQCQVTILDDSTVFENRLISAGLSVAGDLMVRRDAVFRGNVTIEGTLPKDSAFVKQIVDQVVDDFNRQYDEGTFDQYTDRVFTRIAEEGIDASIVLVGDNPIVDNGTLAPRVVNSNLQSVGALKELQVIGETLLDQTLYVSNRRVGINTIEPERALDLWDQEVQIIAGKRQQDTAIFGTIRNQNLIISANNKDQLTVNTDGSVSVKNLNIGRTNHTSGPRMPTDNRPMGHIVWNENPGIGLPIGWVSLGGARWAAFGLIAG